MKRHYISLWLLFLAAFLVFVAAEAFDTPEIGGHKLKDAGFVEALSAVDHEDNSYTDADTFFFAPDTAVMAVQSIYPVPCDTASQTIMLIGDSMLEGLGPRLAAYAEHNGHTLYTVMWYSSTSEKWGKSDKLRNYIQKIKPTFIVVCLGANELLVKDIEVKREKYVKQILADIDTIPFLWIGPPNWRSDTGINRLIAKSTPQGTFFLSDGMSFERAKDGAHPTRSSAAAWLDSVIRWMPANALHPIRLEVPAVSTAKAKRIFVHQPSEE